MQKFLATLVSLMALSMAALGQASLPAVWSDEKCMSEQVELLKARKPGKKFSEYLNDATKTCNELFKQWQSPDNPATQEFKSNKKCSTLMETRIAGMTAEFKRAKPFGNVSDDYARREIEAATEIYDCYYSLSPDYAARYKLLYEESHRIFSIPVGTDPAPKGITPMIALNPDGQKAARGRKLMGRAHTLGGVADNLSIATGQRQTEAVARNTRDAVQATRPVYVIPRPAPVVEK